MRKVWLEMRIPVPPEATDLLGQALLELGCTGITLSEQALDTFEAPGEIPFPEEDISIRAYFPAPRDIETLLARILNCLEELAIFFPELVIAPPEYHILKTEDWANSWQQHFPPFRVGNQLLIRPSWEDGPYDDDLTVLTLDPGRAFGTGTHATTSLCLEVIARLAEGNSCPTSVLDVGTGSGILALAAAALGARSVLACDIDPEARLVARENIESNGFSDQISVTDDSLENITGRFNLVLANILAKENIRLGRAFLQRMGPGSILVLSGILNEQEADVVAAYQSSPLTLISTDRQDDWSCLTYRYDG